MGSAAERTSILQLVRPLLSVLNSTEFLAITESGKNTKISFFSWLEKTVLRAAENRRKFEDLEEEDDSSQWVDIGLGAIAGLIIVSALVYKIYKVWGARKGGEEAVQAVEEIQASTRLEIEEGVANQSISSRVTRLNSTFLKLTKWTRPRPRV